MRIELKPEAIRLMSRAEYKNAASTARLLCRIMTPYWEKAQPKINKAIVDMLVGDGTGEVLWTAEDFGSPVTKAP